MPKRARVECTSQSEPSFIAEFKKRAGMVAEPTIESKQRTMLALDTEDGDRLDEQPQLVWNPESGVSEAEATDFLKGRVLDENRKKVETKETGQKTNTNTVSADQPKPEAEIGRILFVPRSERKPNEKQQPDAKLPGFVSSRKEEQSVQCNTSTEPIRPSAPSKQGFLSFNMDDEDADE